MSCPPYGARKAGSVGGIKESQKAGRLTGEAGQRGKGLDLRDASGRIGPSVIV
jgi:hypothetical protein